MKFYPTFEEAQKAAISLGFKNSRDYFANYKKDPLLPSRPDAKYREEWIDWADFFRLNITEYYSYDEAQEVAISLGIKNSMGYRKDYKADSRLPSNPARTYEECWAGWGRFLNPDGPSKRKKGSYYSYKKAQQSSRKLKSDPLNFSSRKFVKIENQVKELSQHRNSPLGRIPLVRVFKKNILVLEELRRLGATWGHIAQYLYKHGVTQNSGDPLHASHVRTTFNRVKEKGGGCP